MTESEEVPINRNKRNEEQINMTRLMKLITDDEPKAYKKIKAILKKYPEEVKKKNSNGETALFVACSECKTGNRKKIIKKLIEAGADVNSKNNGYQTPLMEVCFNYSEPSSKELMEICKLFINSGVDLNAKNAKNESCGLTALGWLVLSEHSKNYIDVMEYLVSKGAVYGDIYESFAGDEMCGCGDAQMYQKQISFLIKNNVPLNDEMTGEPGPLLSLCNCIYNPNTIYLIKLLIEYGSNIDIVIDGKTPLWHFCEALISCKYEERYVEKDTMLDVDDYENSDIDSENVKIEEKCTPIYGEVLFSLILKTKKNLHLAAKSNYDELSNRKRTAYELYKKTGLKILNKEQINIFRGIPSIKSARKTQV